MGRVTDGEKHDVPEMKWTLSERGANGRGGRWGKYFLPDGKKCVSLHRLSTDGKTERKRVFSIPLSVKLGHFHEGTMSE